MPWLSWARIVGIVGIVSIHVFGHLVTSWGEVSALSWHVGNLMDAASRFSVPLFVMASGAVLLRTRPDSAGGPESLRSFFVRRASRIAIPLVVWTAFFLWFDRWSQGEPVDAYTFVQGYLWGRPYYHLYFLYVVAGLYLLTPFLRVFVAHASRRLVCFAALTSLGLALASKLQHLWMGGGGFNAFTYFVPWIGYYLLGFVLATMSIGRLRRWFGRWRALGAYVLAIGCTTFVTWLFFAQGQPATSLTYDYFMPTTLVAAVGLAIFLRLRIGDVEAPATRRRGRPGRLAPARQIADLTLGIFLLHPIPLQLLRQFGPTFDTTWLQLGYHALQLAGLLVACGLVTYAMHRVPVLRRLV